MAVSAARFVMIPKGKYLNGGKKAEFFICYSPTAREIHSRKSQDVHNSLTSYRYVGNCGDGNFNHCGFIASIPATSAKQE
jgi:hypothetical protein